MGITSSSEDSSELWFLLVENYNYLTAPVGLRIGWESLEKKFFAQSFHCLSSWGGLAEKRSPNSSIQRLPLNNVARRIRPVMDVQYISHVLGSGEISGMLSLISSHNI